VISDGSVFIFSLRCSCPYFIPSRNVLRVCVHSCLYATWKRRVSNEL